MIPLLVATTNSGKAREFNELLKPTFLCKTLPEDTLPAIEDGKTYQENALKKAKEYFDRFKTPVLSDDSGLEVDVLNGEPGVQSATYGGESLSWAERWDFLYRQLGKQANSKPLARFRCVICYYDGNSQPRFFEATTEGYIVSCPKGNEGFGYDPIFFSTELGKTLGEASPTEKSQVSHRARAAKKFLDFVKNQSQ